MGLFDAIGGAVGGLVSSGGNPLGAVVGGLGGLLGGGDQTSRSSQSGTTSGSGYRMDQQRGSQDMTGRTESFTELANWTPEQLAAIQAAQAGIGGGLAALNPEAQAALRQQMFNANFDPMQQQIQQGFTQLGDQQYAAAARRGAASNSTRGDTELKNRVALSNQMGLAANQATMAANQAYLQEQANQRANIAAQMDRMNQLWQQRLAASRQVGTTDQSQTSEQNNFNRWNETGSHNINQSTTGPNTFWNDVLGGVGEQLGDPDSWVSQLGKKIF